MRYSQVPIPPPGPPNIGMKMKREFTTEHRANISAGLKGRSIPLEVRAKMSAVAKKRVNKIHNPTLRDHWIGREKTQEHLVKIGASVSKTYESKTVEDWAKVYQKKGLTIEVRGVTYSCIEEARRELGMTAYFIKKDSTFKRLGNI
jgi:hypothetical protein